MVPCAAFASACSPGKQTSPGLKVIGCLKPQVCPFGKWLPLLLEPLTSKMSHLGLSPQIYNPNARIVNEHNSRSISALSLSFSTMGSYR